MIHVLLVAYDGNAFKRRIDSFAKMVEVQVISGDVTSKGKRMHGNTTFLFLGNIGVVNQVSRLQIVLDFIVIHDSAFLSKNLGY